MPIDASLVGLSTGAVRRCWSSKDALLYAVAIGAGQGGGIHELAFTTENSEGVIQRVIPTFANVALGAEPEMPADVDQTTMLHAEEAVTWHAELPVEGDMVSEGRITDVFDKGSGAMVVNTAEGRDASGLVIATIKTTLFFRGAGGFGGDRGPSVEWELPTGKPDFEVTYTTRLEQALIYRLTGDRNPLHSDPTFAAQAGFETPILHGMCTYGFTGRALLHSVAGSDPARLRSMSARFTRPILPGQALTVTIWRDGSDVRFRTVDDAGNIILDRGSAWIV